MQKKLDDHQTINLLIDSGLKYVVKVRFKLMINFEARTRVKDTVKIGFKLRN